MPDDPLSSDANNSPRDVGREEVVARLNESFPLAVRLGDDELVVVSELVSAIADSGRYAERSITEAGENLEFGSPRHWRLLIPSARHPHGLEVLEFGITSRDVTGHPQEEVRFRHELFCDAQIQHNLVNPAVERLFQAYGGDLIELVRTHGDPVFAAIEIRYKWGQDGYLQWAHLLYSKQLLETAKIIRKRIDATSKHPLPWLAQISSGDHQRDAAEAMALSAFADVLQNLG